MGVRVFSCYFGAGMSMIGWLHPLQKLWTTKHTEASIFKQPLSKSSKVSVAWGLKIWEKSTNSYFANKTKGSIVHPCWEKSTSIKGTVAPENKDFSENVGSYQNTRSLDHRRFFQVKFLSRWHANRRIVAHLQIMHVESNQYWLFRCHVAIHVWTEENF